MTTKNNEQAKIAGFSVFGAKPKDALFIPQMPIVVRNNCQTGQWVLGEKDCGSKVEMSILKFSRFYGDLGQTTNSEWGQVWFITDSGDLPHGVVMCTYIKSRGLELFNTLIATISARGVEPATGIFVPEFVKASGQKADEKGVVKPVNYYYLNWGWKERTDWSLIEQAAAALQDSSNVARLTDLKSTQKMICLDGLSEETINSIRGRTFVLPTVLPTDTATPMSLTGSDAKF